MKNKQTPAAVAEALVTTQQRQIDAKPRAIDGDDNLVELAFSSETPVERWWGTEVLDHGNDSVRMERLTSGAPLLMDHSNSVRNVIGVVVNARIDEDRVGRATVRFSSRDEAQQIRQDVADGILTKVSVGYRIHKVEINEDEDTYRAIDWEPFEISMVAIPADDRVGVGRSNTPAPANQPEVNIMPNAETQAPTSSASDETRIDATIDTPVEHRAEAEAEAPISNTEYEQMLAVGRTFNDEDRARKLAMLGRSLQEYRDMLYNEQKASLQDVPVSRAQPRIEAVPHGRKLTAFPNTPEGRRDAYASGQWIRAALFRDESARQWVEQNLTRVMTGASSLKGGVLIPDPMQARVIELREEYGVARRLAEQVTMSADTLTIPRYSSGSTAYFVGEEDSITASDAEFDQVQLVARKLGVLVRASNDLIEDSVIDLADWVARDIAQQFAQKEDDCYFNGDGTSSYGGITGVRNAILGLAGAIDGDTDHDTFAEIDGDDLDAVLAALPLYAKANATWVMSSGAMATTVASIQRAAGGNTVMDLGNGPVAQYQGHPIVLSQSMPSGASTDYSDKAMILLGDFRLGSIMGTRRDISLRVDESRFMEYDQTAIRATERFDVVVHGVGDASTPGPIVALIGE